MNELKDYFNISELRHKELFVSQNITNRINKEGKKLNHKKFIDAFTLEAESQILSVKGSHHRLQTTRLFNDIMSQEIGR